MHHSDLIPLVLHRLHDSSENTWLLANPGGEVSERLSPMIWHPENGRDQGKFKLNMADVEYTFDTFRAAWAYANEHWGVDVIDFGCWRDAVRPVRDKHGNEHPRKAGGDYYIPKSEDFVLTLSADDLEALRVAVPSSVQAIRKWTETVDSEQDRDVRVFLLERLGERVDALLAHSTDSPQQ